MSTSDTGREGKQQNSMCKGTEGRQIRTYLRHQEKPVWVEQSENGGERFNRVGGQLHQALWSQIL